MIIRDFNSSDKNDFIKFAKDFYSGGAVLHTVSEANFEKTFELCIKGNELVRAVMFELDGKRAGYSFISFMYSNEAGGITVLLEELYIVPEFRGMGLGNEFFDWIEKEYKGVARLRLEVNPENEGALRLYRKRGFDVLGYIQMIKD